MKIRQIPSVAVLMSTYNGEKYLEEQINSILVQEGVQVELFIRDDGSTDHTISILKDYEKRYCNITVFIEDENLGPGKSFMALFYYMSGKKFDYYAFADQDDIWLPNKLLEAIKKIKAYLNRKSNVPLLYGSNQILYQNGRKIGLRYSLPQDTSLAGHLNKNTISGCTFVLNRILMEKINSAPHVSEEVINRRMHDSWVILCAIICGDVIYDENAYILYRIHDSNVVGIRDLSLKNKIMNKYKNLTDKSFSNYRKKTAEQLLKSFPDVKGRNREILEIYVNYQKDYKHKRIFLADKEIINGLGESYLLTKIKVLFNLI